MVKTEQEAIAALEGLSDKLYDLEQPKEINIFDAIGMAKQEVKHSAFLAWLFDNKSSHNKAGLFLSDFLKALYLYTQNDSNAIPSNAQILSDNFTLDEAEDFANASDLRVETEKVIDTPESRIDVFIYSKERNTAVVIENKVFTSTHDDQLNRYEAEVEKFNTDKALKKIFVYLTPLGQIPTDINGNYQHGWCIIDYGTVIENLKQRVGTIKNSKLKYLIEDYIAMVDNKILHNNPTIRALCKKIRREHSEALDILLNYIDNVDMVYKYIATEWLPRNVPDSCNVIANGRKLVFYTKVVQNYYNKCGLKMNTDDGLFRFQISVGSKDGPVTIGMWLSKTADDEWNIADTHIRDVLQPNKRMGEKYCTLYSCTILSEEEREKVFDNDQELYGLIDERLGAFLNKLRDFEMRLISQQ